MKKIIFMLTTVLATSSFAAGLSGGDTYSTENIQGRLSIQCSGPTGTTSGFTECRGQLLNPGEYAYFVGAKVDADHVSLVATHDDGTVSKVKTEEYNSETGKSKKSFNLWIATVFQRPLLNYGKNSVKYVLTKNGSKVEEGTFVVNVVKGGTTTCAHTGFYYSSNANDCTFPRNYCDRYFSEQNYCQ